MTFPTFFHYLYAFLNKIYFLKAVLLKPIIFLSVLLSDVAILSASDNLKQIIIVIIIIIIWRQGFTGFALRVRLLLPATFWDHGHMLLCLAQCLKFLSHW